MISYEDLDYWIAANLLEIDIGAGMWEEFLSYRRGGRGQGLMGNETYEALSYRHDYFRSLVVPKVSTTGDGMLRVIEALRSRGLYVTTESYPRPASHTVSVRMWEDLFADPKRIALVLHESLTYAVALAAKKAIERTRQ